MSILSMTRGDLASFTLTMVDGTGEALDLTGLTLSFTAKRRYLDLDDDAVIAKSDLDGIVVDDDPTSGLAVLTIMPEDTDDLEDAARLVWDLQVDNGSGDVRTPLRGTLVITADATRTSSLGS